MEKDDCAVTGRFNQEEVQKATEHYLEESSSSSAKFKNSNKPHEAEPFVI